jgi:hypothetical protein
MSYSAWEIPLQAAPQSLYVTLGGVAYFLTVRWNAFASTWVLDIADQDSVPISSGLPLLTGVDLLAQYAYLNIAGKLVVQTDQTPYALPTATNLGTDSHLYFITYP